MLSPEMPYSSIAKDHGSYCDATTISHLHKGICRQHVYVTKTLGSKLLSTLSQGISTQYSLSEYLKNRIKKGHY
jgi:hypothetical protein